MRLSFLGNTLFSSSRGSESSFSRTEHTSTQVVESVVGNEGMVFRVENLYGESSRVLEGIEVLVSKKKGQQRVRIVCIPSGYGDDSEIPDFASIGSCDDSVLSDSFDDDNVNRPHFLEEFARTVLEPCQCQTFLKPALRRTRSEHPFPDRSVSFDKVNIKEFPMTLGDHPSASSGPPVALDWDKVERQRSLGLDEYENSRSPRRTRRQLKLSLRDRRGILQRQFSADEVNQAWSEARAIREQRKETIQRGIMLMFMDDMCESASRKIAKMGHSISNVLVY
jgi:hypothetical protein